MNSKIYGPDYYFYGVENSLSNYQNYRWLPEMTLALAMTMIDFLHIERKHTILDFGCAFGYLVKAFRILYRQAWGTDISEFAIENADPMIRQYCFGSQAKCTLIPSMWDFCIAKDVLEHIPKNELSKTVKNIRARCLFAVIPLGDGEKYIAPANNLDVTHIVCEDLPWWGCMFEASGWKVKWSGYTVAGIKDQYYKKYPKAHGFLVLDRK